MLPGLGASRPLIERVLRYRVHTDAKNVDMRTKVVVEGLLLEDGRVAGEIGFVLHCG